MKFREYVSSKAITLCFLGIGGLLAAAFLYASSAALLLIAAVIGCYVMLLLGWLLVSYYWVNQRLRYLERIAGGLEEPYLLGEVLPAPVSPLERQYYEVMKIISHSAIGTVEEANREKEEYCDYVESFIHEIKTPLTACALILSNDGDPRKLKRELKRADNLTENILYYARLRSAEKDVLIKKTSVAAVMEEAIKSQMELLIAAGISVEPKGDFIVYTDDKSLCFILKQLLINCAKYCPGCRIKMHADFGRITVEDNGIGIPDYELSRVTERGFTGTNGRKFSGSTGMGLYIVKALCQQLGIELEIQSQQREYTRIILSFQTLTEL